MDKPDYHKCGNHKTYTEPKTYKNIYKTKGKF